jgi:hypothetical protein
MTKERIAGVTVVTEAKWLACTESIPMQVFLPGKASERKILLSFLACCRRMWHLLADRRIRNGIEVAEQYADGQADDKEMTAGLVAWGAWLYQGGQPRWIASYRSATTEIKMNIVYSLKMETAIRVVGSRAKLLELGSEQCALFREIIGNPFRHVSISPSVLTWNDVTMVRLAQAAYEERRLPAGTLDTNRLRVLADALEEAGCTSDDVLGHLRGPGPHVRGCWVVDLCLGKS